MKKTLGIMAFMIFMLVGFPAGIISILLTKVLGGGVGESFLYPLYGGQIVLSGIIVACTVILYNEIKTLKNEIKELKDK